MTIFCTAMSSIRYRHNYRVITITPSGVLGGSGVSGDCIPAMLRNGELYLAPYRGSMDIGLCKNLQRVKLSRIVAWSSSDDGFGTWFDMPADGYLVGVYTNGCYYIALKDGAPISISTVE